MAYRGKVKSFNLSKCFGFIKSPQVPNDVMFGRNDVPEQFRMHDLVGCEVDFDMSIASDGSGKTKVASMYFTTEPKPIKVETAAALGTQGFVGKIKHFNMEKGFGFITSKEMPGDVMFARADLPDELKTGAGIKGVTVSFDISPDKSKGLRVSRLSFDLQPKADASFDAFGMAAMMGWPMAALGGISNMGHLGVLGSMASLPSKGPSSGNQQYKGSIKNVNTARGFGFIESQDVPSDLWFSIKELNSELDPETIRGMKCSFNLSQNTDGRYRAQDVQLEISMLNPSTATVTPLAGFGSINSMAMGAINPLSAMGLMNQSMTAMGSLAPVPDMSSGFAAVGRAESGMCERWQPY